MTQHNVINYNELDDAALVHLLDILGQLESEKRANALSELLEKAIFIEGKKRRGKTLTALAIAWWLRELFNRPVVVVASRMGLNENFGPFKYLSEHDFRDEMERINVAVSEEENAEQVAKMFDKYGISILYATVIFDEAYKLFNARRPMDKMNMLTANFVAQQAHYHVTTIFTAPSESQVDKNVRLQFDWKGRVYHNKYTHKAKVRFVQGLDTLTIEVDGYNDPTPQNPFYFMYDSWVLLGFRKQTLRLSEDEITKSM